MNDLERTTYFILGFLIGLALDIWRWRTKKTNRYVEAEKILKKDGYELTGTFEIYRISPEMWKAMGGELPEVSTPEEANRFGLSEEQLEDMK